MWIYLFRQNENTRVNYFTVTYSSVTGVLMIVSLWSYRPYIDLPTLQLHLSSINDDNNLACGDN